MKWLDRLPEYSRVLFQRIMKQNFVACRVSINCYLSQFPVYEYQPKVVGNINRMARAKSWKSVSTLLLPKFGFIFTLCLGRDISIVRHLDLGTYNILFRVTFYFLPPVWNQLTFQNILENNTDNIMNQLVWSEWIVKGFLIHYRRLGTVLMLKWVNCEGFSYALWKIGNSPCVEEIVKKRRASSAI